MHVGKKKIFLKNPNHSVTDIKVYKTEKLQ